MTIIISAGLIAAIGALFRLIENDIENEHKAREAEGWIRC